jgi:hypothetical protein
VLKNTGPETFLEINGVYIHFAGKSLSLKQQKRFIAEEEHECEGHVVGPGIIDDK